jgi:protease I
MNCQQLLQVIGLGLIVSMIAGCNMTEAEPSPTPTPVPPTPTPTPVPPRRVLFVIQEDFNPSEYGEPRRMLEEQDTVITVAGPTTNVVDSYAHEIELQPDLLTSEVVVADYDVFVFVGGYPYDDDDPETQRIAREAAAEGKVIAAICNAVIALANAGTLQGRHVASLTYHPSAPLEELGAVPTDADVERDGPFITASGPSASTEFGEAIVDAVIGADE